VGSHCRSRRQLCVIVCCVHLSSDHVESGSLLTASFPASETLYSRLTNFSSEPLTLSSSHNKAFIDIRLRPSVATPLVVAGRPTWPTMAKRDVIHNTGST